MFVFAVLLCLSAAFAGAAISHYFKEVLPDMARTEAKRIPSGSAAGIIILFISPSIFFGWAAWGTLSELLDLHHSCQRVGHMARNQITPGGVLEDGIQELDGRYLVFYANDNALQKPMRLSLSSEPYDFHAAGGGVNLHSIKGLPIGSDDDFGRNVVHPGRANSLRKPFESSRYLILASGKTAYETESSNWYRKISKNPLTGEESIVSDPFSRTDVTAYLNLEVRIYDIQTGIYLGGKVFGPTSEARNGNAMIADMYQWLASLYLKSPSGGQGAEQLPQWRFLKR